MPQKPSEQRKRVRPRFDALLGVPSRMPQRVAGRPGVDQANEGWAHFSTLIAGIGVYGAIGYGLDRLIGTWPILFAIGMVGGCAGGVYLVWIRAKQNASKGRGR